MIDRRRLLGATSAGLFTATAARAQTPATAVPIKIGMITTLSGPGGYLGQDIHDGFQLAIDMGNGTLGGVPVRLVVEDDELKPARGKQIADRMIKNDGIRILTGIVFSNVASATVPDVVDAGALYLSANAAPSTLAGKECNSNYFVISWQNDSLHESTGQNVNNLGYKRAFVLAPNYQAGKDALTGFKRTYKGAVVGEIYTRLDQMDYAAEMAQIRAVNPDVVFQSHPGGLGIAFLRQYQQAGLLGSIPMVLSEPSLDAVTLAAVGEAADGINVTSHWNTDFDNPANKAFMAAWSKAHGRVPTYYASQGYDTALAIASALQATGGRVDIPALCAGLVKADFQSVRGAFRFGPNQHPIQNWYSLKAVKEGDKMVLRTTGVVLKDYGDAYSAQCRL